MHLVRALAAGAALTIASAAAAQSGQTSPGVMTQPLAVGEVLLEVSGDAIGRARPDAATISVSIRAAGANDEGAQAAHDAILRRIRQAATAAGVSPGDITSEANRAELVMFDVEEPPPSSVEPPPPVHLPEGPQSPPIRVEIVSPEPRPQVYSDLSIKVRNLGRLDALTTAIMQAGGRVLGRPRHEVSNDGPARQVALIQALAEARAKADAYASALGLRIVRMVRVTERVGFDFLSVMFGEMTGGPQAMRQMYEPNEEGVAVPVTVGVDFVLAPR